MAFLLLLLGPGSRLLGQTVDRFLHEDGTVTVLESATVLSSTSAGRLALPFNFQPLLIDTQTGKYVIPDLWTAYSLVAQGDDPGYRDPGYRGERWVFGGAHLGYKPQIASFDDCTGQGVGVAILPINWVTQEARVVSLVLWKL